MPSIGRGTYEPPDDVHVFDGAEEDDDAEGSRLPLLIVIALFVLAAFGGVVWLAYTQGVARGRNDAPRTIMAQSGPAKVAADQGGESATQGKGLKIYQEPAPADDQSDKQIAPPPSSAAPETAVVTPPMAVQSGSPKPAAETAAPAVVATKPPPAQATVKTPPVTAPKAPPEIRTATTSAPPVEPEATAPPAQLGLKTPAQHAATGAYVLQIGAYKSQAEADAAWNIYRSRHAASLSGYEKDVKQVDLGAKGTWYRLRVGGFASKDAAAQLCSKLTAEGGACFPAK
jgi:cell division protein FtsN